MFDKLFLSLFLFILLFNEPHIPRLQKIFARRSYQSDWPFPGIIKDIILLLDILYQLQIVLFLFLFVLLFQHFLFLHLLFILFFGFLLFLDQLVNENPLFADNIIPRFIDSFRKLLNNDLFLNRWFFGYFLVLIFIFFRNQITNKTMEIIVDLFLTLDIVDPQYLILFLIHVMLFILTITILLVLIFHQPQINLANIIFK